MQFYNTSSNTKMPSTTTSIVQQLSPLNVVASWLSFRRWLQDNDTPIEDTPWELQDTECEKLCQETPEYLHLIDWLLNKRILKVKVSNRADEMGHTLSANDRRVFETDMSRKLYSLVDFQTRLQWGQLPFKKQRQWSGEKLEITRNNDTTRMGLDSFGYYWGEYSLPLDEGTVRVRITYLHNKNHPFAQHPECFPNKKETQPPEFHQLLLDHQNTKPKGFLSYIFGSTSSITELPDSILGFRIQSVKIPVSNSAIACILGSQHGDWKVLGAQMKGGFQINSLTPLNLEMESVCVATTRSMDESLTQDGYLDFFQEDPIRFCCLYEVWIQDTLVFATLGDETYSYGST